MTQRASAKPPRRVSRWYLESMVEGGRQLRRKTVYPYPFRVGRLASSHLTLESESVSKEHAVLFERSGQLWVRDLGSRNGTFVNSEKVQESSLREGDILHVAQVELRLGRQEIEEPGEEALEPATVRITEADLPQQFVEGTRELPELLEKRQVTALFQPIVSLPSGALAGYEALGRGLHPRLPEMPLDLFKIAARVKPDASVKEEPDASVKAEAELSRLFREKALELVASKGRFPALFINIHPAELDDSRLVPAVLKAHEYLPHLRLTLEIPQGALDNLKRVDQLQKQLKPDIYLAYDDFGAGQARLLELAEVPPTYLKFDMSFVRGIDSAPRSRQQLLTSLVAVARDLLVYTVAEGVETAEEADVCMRLNFTHAQGFFFGRPRPITDI